MGGGAGVTDPGARPGAGEPPAQPASAQPGPWDGQPALGQPAPGQPGQPAQLRPASWGGPPGPGGFAPGPAAYPGGYRVAPGGFPPPPTVRMTATRPDEGLLPPVGDAAMPGTPYRLALVGLPRTPSGPAAASLPLGIASILVSLVVICFAAVGARDGWGPAVAGAFALLSGFAGVGAIVLGQVGLRQTRMAPGRITGRGPAIAGIVCAIVGLAFSAFAIVISLAAA
jgi:hypothetical protein